MYESETLPLDYANPMGYGDLTDYLPSALTGLVGSGTSAPLVFVGSGGWQYKIEADGTITVLNEPSGKYRGIKRTAADGRMYDAIVNEGVAFFSRAKQATQVAALLNASAASKKKYQAQYTAALKAAKPTAPSTPTFAPVPGAPGAAPDLPAPPGGAAPAGAFYEQWWFPPLVAVGVLAAVGTVVLVARGKT